MIDAIDLDESAALLALNNEHARELSWLEPDRFAHLVRAAFWARRIGAADAFILAFGQDADYDGENFLWFKARYETFVYVDRIVVAAAARGRGLARILYQGLFAAARAAGQSVIACEVNFAPPNPESDAFHAAFGVQQVGTALLRSGEKTVRYLRLDL
jgi:predicted GNAT superfamily acetyltransferase